MATFEEKLEALHRQLADLDADRIDSIQTAESARMELEGIDEWFKSNPRVVKLAAIIPKSKMAEGELAYITKANYRKIMGKEPLPVILTKDGKRVRWEYALDSIAQELRLEEQYGFKADEALRDMIMMVPKMRERKRELRIRLEKMGEEVEDASEKLEAATEGVSDSTEVLEVQAERSARSKAMDAARQAKNVLPFPKFKPWLKRPGRYDIEGIDTKRNGNRKRRKAKAQKPRAKTRPGIATVR